MAQGKKNKGGKKRKITSQLFIEKANKKSKQPAADLKEEEEQVVEEINSDCEEDDGELSTPGFTPILPEENNFDQVDDDGDEEIMQTQTTDTTQETQESFLLGKDIQIKPDSNGRAYFEVEVGEQSSENDEAREDNENVFEIGLYKGGNFLGITNSGIFNVDGKKVDMEIGEIKQGDVVGVFYSFGLVYFTHNGKKIAHPFEWKDVKDCFGIIYYRYEHQKFSFNTTGNFLFPGYKGTNEDDVQCRFSEIRQKLNQIEQSYLRIEKDNRELKESSSASDRLALTSEELSTLSQKDIYEMQDVLHQSLGLINEEIRKRNKL